MARIRTIKPDAFKSDTLSQVPREVRWTFAGLWTYLDDEGRGRYDPRLLKAEIYPLDDDVTPSMIHAEISTLNRLGSVCIYELGGRQYIHVPSWSSHQKINRPTASKLPQCPSKHGFGVSAQGALTDDSVRTHGRLTVGKGTGNREQGTGKGRNTCASTDVERDSDTLSADFAAWWSEYPRKKAKGAAVRAYKTARKKADATTILSGLRAALPEFAQRQPEHVPYPATWLNAEGWTDEHAPKEVRTLPHASQIEQPPSGLTDAEMSAWHAARNPAYAELLRKRAAGEA